MRKFFHNLLVFFLCFCAGSSNNTPPNIYLMRDWVLTENEPLGSIVDRIQVHDADNDPVNLTLGQPSSRTFDLRKDGASFFNLNADNQVTLAKSLRGMAGESFLVGVIASDGHKPNHRIDVKVVVTKSKKDFLPRPSGLPISFDPGPPPPLSEFHDHNYDDHLPPLLHLDPNTKWDVQHLAAVGAHVAKVEAEDLSNTFLLFSISPKTLLRIDPITGEVTVATLLVNQVGEHSFEVKVEDKFAAITETVVLRVTTDTKNQPVLSSTTTHFYSTTMKTSTQVPPVHSVTKGDVTPSSGETRLGWNVVGLVFVFGFIPVLVGSACFLYRWKKKAIKKGQQQQSLKASSLPSFAEKRGSISSREVDRRDSILDGIFSMVGIHKGLENTTFEDETKVPRIPSRKWKSIKSCKSLSSIGEGDPWEFPRHKLHILEKVGEGCFGQVWKCEATDLVDVPTVVAVKTLKESAGAEELKDLFQELKVLKNLGHHPNVVSLLGCCTEKEPVFVILEFMVGGKLQSYLRSSRARHSYSNLHGTSLSLTPRDLTIFALQVARGMDFLSKNGIIHRDLAARNVLVGSDKVCKVADFGFARDVANNHVYERKSDGKLPIRWMATESLFDHIFTSKSDVWSFGILLWEIVTLGSTPYPGMSAADVMKNIKDGYRLEKPAHCRREIYNIMNYCWNSDQGKRPSFADLVHTFESLILSEVEYIHLDNFPDHTYYNFNTGSTSGELL